MTNGFYFPPSRLNFISQLQNDCEHTGVLVIEGAMGVGKTTVLEECLTSVMPAANKCYVTLAQSLNDIQVRSRIVEQLFGNVLYDPEKPLLGTFLEFHHSTPILLALDNGHYLSGQLIGELLQVVAELKKRDVQIVLLVCYDKSVSNTWGSISSALIVVKRLKGLNADESFELLNQSFDHVPSASTTKVKRWIEDSKGNPMQLLAYDSSGNLKVVREETFNLKLWGSIIVLASLILSLGVYYYRVYFASADENKIQTPQAISEQVKNKIKTPVVSDWSEAKIREAAIERKAVLKETQTETETETETAVATRQDILSALSLNNVPEVVTSQEVDASLELAAPLELEVLPEQEASQDAIDETISEERPKTESVTSEIETAKPELVVGYPIQTQAMLALPTNKFVLQLTAVTQTRTLEDYLNQKQPAKEHTRIYRIERNGQTWLILTYGLFDTIAAAREEAKNIDMKAWAKSVSVIQQQIKTYNQTLSQ
jgi:septal ring-binding cell division protein DamX